MATFLTNFTFTSLRILETLANILVCYNVCPPPPPGQVDNAWHDY